MSSSESTYPATGEIARIYQSLIDKKVLCDFFLESVFPFIGVSEGFLFLLGTQDHFWLETQAGCFGECPAGIKSQIAAVLKEGKPARQSRTLFVPLIVRNSLLGAVCFGRKVGPDFTDKDLNLVFDLASQFAGALKNLLLHEENVKMERLAAVGETISMVMHELKNIIQIAKLSDELIRRGISKNNEAFLKHGLEGTERLLRSMDGFVWDMLSLTKNYMIEPRKVHFRSLMEELKKDFGEKAQALAVRLDLQVEDSLSEVDLDPRALYRALFNLVQNAMEACDKDESWVRVRVRSKNEDHYEIVVEDNGKGMTDETKAKIFQGFFTTKGSRGNGLGLLIIQRVLRAHRGEIQVESEVGKGTRFILTASKKLPAAEN